MMKENTAAILRWLFSENNMRHLIIPGLISLLMVLWCCPAYAEANPAAFLNTGVGVRAMGMGGAYTSISDDPSAMYWNPAGVAKIQRLGITVMGQSMGAARWDTLSDVTPVYQFVGIILPLQSLNFINILGDDNAVGIGYISNTLGGVPYTFLDDSGVIVREEFDDRECAWFLSYGFSLLGMDSLLLGGTLKYITQEFTRIEGASASGYDFDAGMIYSLDEGFNVGVLLQRGAELQWANGHTDAGPFTTKLGVSKKFVLPESFSVLGSADIVQRQTTPLFSHFGAELGYEQEHGGEIFSMEGIFLRLGLDGVALEDRYEYRDKINNNVNFTAGIGVKFSYQKFGIQLDYAMGSYRLGDKNRFSLNIYL